MTEISHDVSPSKTEVDEKLPANLVVLDRNDLENPSTEPTETDGETLYPHGLSLALLLFGLFLAAFAVGLDRTIVATAAPRITDDFHSPGDIGWYGSAYLLTASAFLPTYGRVYTHFDVKWSFLVALALFEVGSLLCGVAPTSVAFIIGRAIAGTGCAGILSGSFAVVSSCMPLERRPVYISMIGAIFGVAAVLGPVLGGVFTGLTTWRWCFWFNLPIGAVTLITLLFFFKGLAEPADAEKLSFLRKVLSLDLVGTSIILCSVAMLILPLQWGGTEYQWSSGTVIGLLIGFAATAVIFLGWLKYRGDNALIPLGILVQRTVIASCIASLALGGCLLTHSYYLPYYFQAIGGDSPVQSAIHVIPYVAMNYGTSLVTAVYVTRSGWFNPPAIIGPAIGAVGSGFLSTLSTTTRVGDWVGYQILAAAGLGMATQQTYLAIQTVLPKEQASIGTALALFVQNLSGAIFIAAGDNLLRNGLKSGLEALNNSQIDIGSVLNAGATDIRTAVPASALADLLVVYSGALQKVFIMAIPLAGLGFLAGLAYEWKNIKRKEIVPAAEA